MIGRCVSYQGSNENVSMHTGYDYAQIYTDWANYYLERTKSKKKVTDLSTDCRDGLLLADVIEAVTSFKVSDLIKKPKNSQQMRDNVGLCLDVLRAHSVGGVEAITPEDVYCGKLKAILALFFALSRYKQQYKQSRNNSFISNSKHQQQQHPQLQDQRKEQLAVENIAETSAMSNRPSVTNTKGNNLTAIPLPSTVPVQRRGAHDKVRPLPPTPNQTAPVPCLIKSNINCNNRPNSPPSSNSNLNSQKVVSNGLRPPSQCKSDLYVNVSENNASTKNAYGIPQDISDANVAPIVIMANSPANNKSSKQSMLEKLKLFHNDKLSSANVSLSTKFNSSKRTSSSSGISSARSEKSDSSLSLNDTHKLQMKAPTSQRIKESKNSKLYPQKQSISSNSRSKTELKDKSPARKLLVEENKTVGTLKSEIKTKSGSKTLLSKLRPRSEPKQSLLAIPKPTIAPNNSNGTCIPKPVAAVKGTSKLVPSINIDAKFPSESIDPSTLTLEKKNISKTKTNISEHNKIVHDNNRISNQQIVMPLTDIRHQNHSLSDSLTSINTTHRSCDTSLKCNESTVKLKTDIRAKGYNLSNEHTQEFKNQYKYHFTNSPVHYQQQLSEIPNKRQESHSYHSTPKKLIPKTYGEEKSSNVLPMRPMLRGYNSHLTLPSRSSLGKQHCVAEFFDLDTNHGYCSDGDILRRGYNQISAQSRLSDVENGYLSEGGGVGHGKNILSLMKTRMQLPTTIEEKFRSNHSLESIDKIEVPMTCGDKSNMDINSFEVKREDWIANNEGTVNGKDHQQASHQQIICNSENILKDKLLNTPRQNALLKQSMSSSSSSRSKGVPRSFGSITRLNGSSQAGTILTSSSEASPNSILLSGRTAHVSAMPRSGKIKASSNTNEMPKKSSTSTQHRSFSLTGPGAIQLSQSIRERLSNGSHSLPKPGTDLQALQHRISNHVTGKILDGSLSDTQTYAEVKPEYSTYAMWLKHSNTAGCRLSEGDSLENVTINSPNMSRQSHKVIHRGGESMFSQSPRINRSNSIRSTKSEKMYPSMLSRGHDIESEPYYCLPIGAVVTSQSNRTNAAAVPWSQPTSPTPPNRSTLSGVAGNFNGPLSPTQGCPFTMNSCQRLTYPKKNDEVHGSAASLLSGGSSLYSSAEERQANEIRRLKRELADAKDQVMSLSSQLSTNAHVVTAFEQSLGNMTSRLQHLTATAERKDSELTDMRQTIELLRKQSIQAGLTTAHMQSMGVQTNNQCDLKCKTRHQHQFKKTYSSFQPNSIDDNKSNSHIPSTSSPYSHKQCNNNQANVIIQRHHSSDSMCSLNSISSNCSVLDKKKKKGWLRSSFTKAFSRNAKISKTNRHTNGGFSNNSEQTGLQSNNMSPVANSSTLRQQPQATQHNSKRSISSPTHSILNTVTVIENAKPIDAIEVEENTVVEDLKKQLREKDLVLTDIRLEALSSASQLESLKDTVMKMRAEMISLKQNNEKLQKLVTSRSLAGSESSIGHAISPNGTSNESRRYSLADGSLRPPMDLPKSLEEEVEEENIPPAPAPEPPPSLNLTTHIDLTPPPPAIEQVPSPNHLPNSIEDVPDVTDGKKLAICVYLGQPESFPKYNDDILESDEFYSSEQKHSTSDDVNTKNNLDIGPNDQKTFPTVALNEFVIAYTYISGKTTWQNLDYIVRKTFKDYVSRIDPGTNLGLNTDSITSYHLGEAKRGPEMGFPELLPCGYIIGNVRSLYICLQGVGSLAFDSLIPRSIVHRYISLLTEHRRLILCGPSGTGKSYLARRLAEFLVARVGRGNPSEAIATFNVDHKSSKELRQYLSHIAEQASMGNSESELPSVIILDNLHHASALGDVFSCLLSAGSVANLPCIIGTMSQATCNTTNLQLHHNFRWVLTANHMEPVKGFLGRFLRRRLFIVELQTLNHQPELSSVMAWLPTVWQHINRFLENHSSSDVTIGPRLFLSCPLDLKDSQVWFTDIWNYHLAPYLIEAVREGVQLYGRRGGAWNDPSTFICDTYPWPYGPESVAPLRQVNAEDVGLEGNLSEQTDSQDPLLNMLMRLQEAANYSEIQEQESDCASLDSNVTPESSAGAE